MIKSFSKKILTTKAVRLIFLGLLLVVNGFFLHFNSFRVFNFFDMGPFLDASWRVYKGQIPYVDFIYFSGPLHFYMNAFFFHLFGFNKVAILANLVTVSSVVIIATYVLARKLTNIYLSALLISLSAACFYWPISHPWYDQSAHLWGIIAVVFLTTQLPIRQGDRKSLWTSALCGGLTALIFLTKSNIGFAYGFVFLIFFVSSKNPKLVISYIGSFLFIFLVAIISTSSLERYFEQAFLYFGKIPSGYLHTRRLLYLLTPVLWLSNFYWIISAIVMWYGRENLMKYTQESILFFGIIFVGIFSTLTGSMVRAANIPLLGIACTLASRTIQRVRISIISADRKQRFRLATLALSILTVLLILKSAVVEGFELRAWTYTGKPFGHYKIKTDQIAGWLTDEETGQDLDEMVQFIRTEVPQNETLLVLTDMQILYALTNRDSYRGIPFIFHPGYMPAPGKQLEEVRQNILNHPPDWIVLHRFQTSFVTFLPQYLKLRDFIVASYEPVKSWNNYAILKKHQ